MAEVLIQYTTEVAAGGRRYVPRACGEPREGVWHGWIEFLGNDGTVVRTDRETTQPNHDDLAYWATGLSGEYLEGALERALRPVAVREPADILPPQASPPRSAPRAAPLDPTRAVLDPFTVYAQGEGVLRKELSALSGDHLRNIIVAYDLADADDIIGASEADLSAVIVSAVRARGSGVG